MANEKILNTRIQLKYDSYANWVQYNPTLLAGEIAVAKVVSDVTLPVDETKNAPVLFKVGPGKFNDLPWASALAADVHSWAKKSEDEFKTWVNTIVEHPAAPVIDTGSANGTISVDGEDVAVKGLGSAAYTDSTAYAPANIDTGVHSVELASGTNNGTVKLIVDGEVVDNIAVTGLQDAAYTTVEALNATAKGYADAVEAKIPTEVGVMTVTAADDTVVVEGEKDVTIKVAPNKFDAYGAAEAVQGNLTAYEEAHKDDYTNSKIDELVQGAKDYADANDANTEYHVEYDSTNKKIKLVAGADASKMEIDATDFIKDGMIDTVTIGEDNDLVITFNTAAGKDEIKLPLDQLVDIYTGSTGDRIVVTVASDKSISAELVAGSISKSYLDSDVQASLSKADTALQSHQSLEHLATKKALEDVVDGTTPVAKATKAADADMLGGQLPAYYATADSVTEITKDNGTIDTKIKAVTDTFGDIVTHNAAEFATNAEDGAKALADENKLAIDAINHAETGILVTANKYTDSAIDGLHTIATSGSAYDLDEVGTAMKGEETVSCFFFYCGTATDLV